MFSQKSNRVSPAIGMVARVQAKGNALRVSLFQKGFDLVFMLDVGLDMGMKNEFKPKAFVNQIGQCLCRLDQPLPPVFVKTARARRPPSMQIDVDVVEEHHIFSVHTRHHCTHFERLFFYDWPQRRIFQR